MLHIPLTKESAHACKLSADADLALTINTPAVINLNTINLDTSALMADTANKRILINKTGLYLVSCRVIFSAPGYAGLAANVPMLICDVMQNAEQSVLTAYGFGIAGSFPSVAASAVCKLTAGTSLFLRAMSTASGVVAQADPGALTSLSVTLL